MRVFFTNLGCKLNQAEIERMSRDFVRAGHRLVGRLEEADLHVVNSCTVTHVAARTSRKTARRGRRIDPSIRTVLTGCYVAAEPRVAARLAGVDLVVPNDEKELLVERVEASFPDLAAAPPAPRSALPVPYVPLEFGHARAMVKIGDGCNMRCSFCIIPFTRGSERYRDRDEIVAEVARLVAGGYREVVVTGVQISSYRKGGERLYELVAAILEGSAVERLRLTSIAPWDFDRRLFGLFADRRLCRHVHLSLQSGSSATLARMRRPYSAASFAEVLEEIRRRVPGVAVTTDVIVGFPGESDEEFADSLAFVERMAFSRVHAFPYSRRDGTAAADLAGQIDPATRKERMRAMLEVAEASERRFWARHLGGTFEVLWEGGHGGRWHGLTDNYIRVTTESEAPLRNRLTTVRLTALGPSSVVAETLSPGEGALRSRGSFGHAPAEPVERVAHRYRQAGLGSG